LGTWLRSISIFKKKREAPRSLRSNLRNWLSPEEQIAAKVLAERADAKLRRYLSLPKFFDRGSMVVETAGDNVYFQTISRTGQTIDSGTVARQ